jgi:hypothetical protein
MHTSGPLARLHPAASLQQADAAPEYEEPSVPSTASPHTAVNNSNTAFAFAHDQKHAKNISQSCDSDGRNFARKSGGNGLLDFRGNESGTCEVFRTQRHGRDNVCVIQDEEHRRDEFVAHKSHTNSGSFFTAQQRMNAHARDAKAPLKRDFRVSTCKVWGRAGVHIGGHGYKDAHVDRSVCTHDTHVLNPVGLEVRTDVPQRHLCAKFTRSTSKGQVHGTRADDVLEEAYAHAHTAEDGRTSGGCNPCFLGEYGGVKGTRAHGMYAHVRMKGPILQRARYIHLDGEDNWYVENGVLTAEEVNATGVSSVDATGVNGVDATGMNCVDATGMNGVDTTGAKGVDATLHKSGQRRTVADINLIATATPTADNEVNATADGNGVAQITSTNKNAYRDLNFRARNGANERYAFAGDISRESRVPAARRDVTCLQPHAALRLKKPLYTLVSKARQSSE